MFSLRTLESRVSILQSDRAQERHAAVRAEAKFAGMSFRFEARAYSTLPARAPKPTKGKNVRMRDTALRFIILFSMTLLFTIQKAQAQQISQPQPRGSAIVGGICLVDNGCGPNPRPTPTPPPFPTPTPVPTPTPAPQQLGGIIAGNPGCAAAADPSGDIICATRNDTNGMTGIRFNPLNGTSSGYNLNLGGLIFSIPSCASTMDGTGDISCLLLDTTNAMLGLRFNPNTGFQTSFESLGGVIIDDPSCASVNDGTGDITCGVKGTNNELLGVRFNPKTGANTGLQGLILGTVGSPSCVAADDGTGQVICAILGTNNGLLGVRFDPKSGAFSGAQSLGGIFLDNPGCAAADDGTGQIICAIKQTNNTLAGVRFNPNTSFNSGFQQLGGTLFGIVFGNPSCGSNGAGGAVCAVRDANSTLLSITFNPTTGSNSGFIGLTTTSFGALVGEPSCVNNHLGHVICSIKFNTNNSLVGIVAE